MTCKTIQACLQLPEYGIFKKTPKHRHLSSKCIYSYVDAWQDILNPSYVTLKAKAHPHVIEIAYQTGDTTNTPTPDDSIEEDFQM